MLKYLTLAALMLSTPSFAATDALQAQTDAFCMYGGVLYTKGAILQIDGQPTLICAFPDENVVNPDEELALEWLDYETWKKGNR